MSSSRPIHSVVPAAPRMRSAWARCSASTCGLPIRPVAPAPTSAGVFGIARTIARPRVPSQPASCAMRMPAAIETTSGRERATAAAISAHTGFITCGLTASTSTPAPSAAAAALSCTSTPKSRASAWRRSRLGSATTMDACVAPPRASAPIRLRAMFPPPMNAMRACCCGIRDSESIVPARDRGPATA